MSGDSRGGNQVRILLDCAHEPELLVAFNLQDETLWVSNVGEP